MLMTTQVAAGPRLRKDPNTQAVVHMEEPLADITWTDSPGTVNMSICHDI